MNVGIIGCGYVCDTYMGTWDRHPRLKILGVADIDQARAEKISKLYNLRRYASNEEMLADPAVEARLDAAALDAAMDPSRDFAHVDAVFDRVFAGRRAPASPGSSRGSRRPGPPRTRCGASSSTS